VFEHIAHPWQAFLEVKRVLKPGGVAIITVPIDPTQEKTFARAKIVDGSVVHLTTPAYHLDPLRPEGVLVFTDFGLDLPVLLGQIGLEATLLPYEIRSLKTQQFVLVLKRDEHDVS